MAFTYNDHGHAILGSTHGGAYAVPFRVHPGGLDSTYVYAHDSGQRYHWSFAAEPAIRSCQEWLSDSHVPTGSVGTVDLIPISWISSDRDEYVG